MWDLRCEMSSLLSSLSSVPHSDSGCGIKVKIFAKAAPLRPPSSASLLWFLPSRPDNVKIELQELISIWIFILIWANFAIFPKNLQGNLSDICRYKTLSLSVLVLFCPDCYTGASRVSDCCWSELGHPRVWRQHCWTTLSHLTQGAIRDTNISWLGLDTSASSPDKALSCLIILAALELVLI